MKHRGKIGLGGFLLGILLLVIGSMTEKRFESFSGICLFTGVILILGSVAFLLISGLILKDRIAKQATDEANTWIEQKTKQVSAPPSEAQSSSVAAQDRTGFSCPVCNSNLQQTTNAPFKVTVGSEILECKNCGTVWSPASRSFSHNVVSYLCIAAGVVLLIVGIAVAISVANEKPDTVNLGGGVAFTNPQPSPILAFIKVGIPSLILLSWGARGIAVEGEDFD